MGLVIRICDSSHSSLFPVSWSQHWESSVVPRPYNPQEEQLECVQSMENDLRVNPWNIYLGWMFFYNYVDEVMEFMKKSCNLVIDVLLLS